MDKVTAGLPGIITRVDGSRAYIWTLGYGAEELVTTNDFQLKVIYSLKFFMRFYSLEIGLTLILKKLTVLFRILNVQTIFYLLLDARILRLHLW